MVAVIQLLSRLDHLAQSSRDSGRGGRQVRCSSIGPRRKEEFAFIKGIEKAKELTIGWKTKIVHFCFVHLRKFNPLAADNPAFYRRACFVVHFLSPS